MDIIITYILWLALLFIVAPMLVYMYMYMATRAFMNAVHSQIIKSIFFNKLISKLKEDAKEKSK